MSETHITIPQPGAAFYTDLAAFLVEEPAQRDADRFSSMVVSGGIHGTVGSLTATPSPLTAYPGGYYITEIGAITYPASRTSWAIAHKDTTADLATFVRQPGTHYLVDRTSSSKPALPDDCLWLMEVVTNGSAIITVSDLRTRSPLIPQLLFAELPASGRYGQLAFVTDYNFGTLFVDMGSQWQPLAANPMTTLGDLIYGLAGGQPARFPIGSANQVLGVSAGLVPEYKSLTTGAGLTITHGVGTITFETAQTIPSGALSFYIGTSAPTGWLLCDGSSVVLNSFQNLAAPLVSQASVWGLPAPTGDFTVDAGTDICTCNGHGLVDGQYVQLGSSAALPSPLVANTIYKIKSATLNTFQLGVGVGNPTVDILDAGTGTHSIYASALLPKPASRLLIAAGAGVGLTARTLGQSGGAENISLAAMPTHNHAVTDAGHAHTVPSGPDDATGTPVLHTVASNTPTTTSTSSITTGISLAAAGSSAADGNMPPWMAFTLIIKT